MQYQVFGRTDSDAPTVVLSSGLGGMHQFWRPQIEALGKRFRIIGYDHRGTGANAEQLPDNYSIEHMAEDIHSILEMDGSQSVHIVGHALGALIGLAFARKYPQRARSLVLVNGWAAISQHTRRCFDVRCELLLASGVKAYVKAQPIFLYPAAWLEARADEIAHEEEMGLKNFQGSRNLLNRIGALLNFDATEWIHEVRCPMLVSASRDDVLVPWTCSETLASKASDASIWLVENGGHAFTVVDPDPFNDRVSDFLCDTN